MLSGRQHRGSLQQRHNAGRVRSAAGAARRQPLPGGFVSPPSNTGGHHPFTRVEENTHLYDYESRSKRAFDSIESVLRRVSALQHEATFVAQAQQLARNELGFELPQHLLDSAWVAPLDMRALYAWCVFETFRIFANGFYQDRPLAQSDDNRFQSFIEGCGFHTLDVSPCADGRLAHVIRYVLRLPYKGVRRKSYAGAMFDVEDSLQKWIETEFMRYREARPNSADAPTRYLKAAVYHYSSSDPSHEGCAAHGSDADKAAKGALSRLLAFQQGVENSFCCGASIDLLLIGIDTDSDAIRIHVPDSSRGIDPDRYIDANAVYHATRNASAADAQGVIAHYVAQASQAQGITPLPGMLKLVAYLLCNNISQIDYVRSYYNGHYSDIGHQERFIGMGVGFEEVQLRNLTYFAYLKTVEQGAKDVDVGIKIFTGLNISRGLPAPVIIRYDYHGNVPGARERAVARCHCLERALKNRFADIANSGLLHTLLVVRDCNADNKVELVGGSVPEKPAQGAH